MKKKICIFSSIFVLLLVGCKKEKDWLARVGDRKISAKEFEIFYELDPNFGIDSSGISALRDELDVYIDRVLAAEKAQQINIADSSFFRVAVDWEKRQAMLRQLYREVVQKDIRVTENELREAFRMSQIKLHVRHLFTRDEQKARQWYADLRSKKSSFEQLAAIAFEDSALAVSGGDLGWMPVGDLDDAFAAAALALGPDQISRPVRTRWGYHIIQLLNRTDPVIIREADFQQQKEKMRKKVFKKKSRMRSSEFIKTFIGRMNPQPVSKTFSLLRQTLITGNETDKAGSEQSKIISATIRDELKIKLANHLDDVLIRYEGGQVTLGQWLDALEKIPLGDRPRFGSPRRLSDAVGKWIRDELLFSEAERRGLRRHPRVEGDVMRFMEEQSYYYLLNRELNNLDVPPDIKNWFAAKDNSNKKLRKFHTLNEWKWWRAQKLLHRKLRDAKPAVEINSKILMELNKKINWGRRIRMYMVRKPS